jgi:Novel toxin 16
LTGPGAEREDARNDTEEEYEIVILFIDDLFRVVHLVRQPQAWAGDKKGGETCSRDAECETAKCSSGKCDPCPDRNKCPPPGVCTRSELDRYQAEVTRWCKELRRGCQDIGKLTNDQEVPANEIKARLEVAGRCVKARDEAMNRCFKGGDDNHREERRNARVVVDYCEELLRVKLGKSLAYTCSESDYRSYTAKVDRACNDTRKYTCTAKKDKDVVDCRALESAHEAAEDCVTAYRELGSRCFGGKLGWVREKKRQEAEAAQKQCKDVHEYKKSNKACK